MNALFERLSSAFATRDAFISNAAHQLRNPIAGIQAQAEAAESAPDEYQLRERVAGVAEAARRTSRLTQQLLSLEKAKGRAVNQHDVGIDLNELAADVMKNHAPAALRRGVTISFDVEGKPTVVQGDRVMLAEALDNLVDNALRYGCADGGALEVRVTYEQDRAKLMVRDHGPGVPDTEREQIFERFHRAIEDGVDGCGLGLPIVREVAKRHGGDVHLAETAEGARFDLTLPYPAQISAASA
jgi:two-component system sensor histidine kinase TctE